MGDCCDYCQTDKELTARCDPVGMCASCRQDWRVETAVLALGTIKAMAETFSGEHFKMLNSAVGRQFDSIERIAATTYERITDG